MGKAKGGSAKAHTQGVLQDLIRIRPGFIRRIGAVFGVLIDPSAKRGCGQLKRGGQKLAAALVGTSKPFCRLAKPMCPMCYQGSAPQRFSMAAL